MRPNKLDYHLFTQSRYKVQWFRSFVAEKLKEQKAAGFLTPDMEFVEQRLKDINDYHAIESRFEGRGGAVYGGPTGFADMFQYNDPQELQVVKRRLSPWSLPHKN